MGARAENPFVNEYFFKFWGKIFFPYLEQENIKTIVHLGDVVDRRKFVNYKILNCWRVKFFQLIHDLNIDFHILLGNHDIFYRNTSIINAMDELVGHYPNITIYSNPQDVHFIEDNENKSFPIAFIPWINDGNREETIKFLETSVANVAFGHLEIEGFEMDRGHVCDVGLSRTMFKRFKQVYSGHFHHKSDDGHIFYLGNQYEITWSDFQDPRGFHVFDTDTQTMTHHLNPYHLFHKILYDDETMDFQYWKQFNYEKHRNTYTKVVVTKKQNPYLFETMLEQLYKHEPIDVMVVEDVIENQNLIPESETISQSESTLDILYKHIDNQEFTVKKEPLKNILKEVYVEALNVEHTS